MSVSEIIRKFEETQIAFVENRDGESGVTAQDSRVTSRVISLMAITLAEGKNSWKRFGKLIEEFEAKNK